MGIRILVALVITLAGAAISVRRALWLARLVRSGAAAPGRPADVPARVVAQLTEVLGQRKLFKRWRSGLPHALVFWGFLLLTFTIIEAYGNVLVSRDFAVPLIGRTAVLGFAEDLFTVIVLAGLVVFAGYRLVESPKRRGRGSRFYGSHAGVAWLTLVLISAVLVTLLLYRAAQVNTGYFPFGREAFASYGLAQVLDPLGEDANATIETVGLLANIGVIMGFLVFVLHSKHLHIFLAPLNVAFSRRPRALGALAELPPTPIGAGAVHELPWTSLLDTLACTECGRCQASCPAWDSGRPLSPKLLMMGLRDHLLESADNGAGAVPLLPTVVSPDVIWSCTTCGACVEQCPVDVEHIDTIVQIRRRQVDEGQIDPGVQQVLQADAQQGNTFGKSARMRTRWTRQLAFPVKDARKEPVRYLWFVGDYAAFDERLQGMSRQLAGILHDAGVDFGLLYEAERDDGNDIRRVGEEGLFQMLVEQNLAAFAAADFETIFTTDPHAFNTLRNEYPQHGLDKPVLHYSQLLEQLLQDGSLTVGDPLRRRVTYHDPCYLARHNRLLDPPRAVIRAVGCALVEMPRSGVNTFCCGAGGGQIWMTGGPAQTDRPSESRIREAVALGVDHFVVSCPKDYVMFTDAVKTTGNEGRIEVVDLIQLVDQTRAGARPPLQDVAS